MGTIQQAIKNCGSSDHSISNQGLINLGTELEKHPNAQGLITPWFRESDLSFAVSKVINEVCAVFAETKGMQLDNHFNTYKKITALLMIYDYCKTHASDTLHSNFDAIVHNSIASKKSDARVQANKEKIEDFISKLVVHSTYNPDTHRYTISLDGYSSLNQKRMQPHILL